MISNNFGKIQNDIKLLQGSKQNSITDLKIIRKQSLKDYFTFAISQQSASQSGQQRAAAAAMLAVAGADQMPSGAVGAPVFYSQQQQPPAFIPYGWIWP